MEEDKSKENVKATKYTVKEAADKWISRFSVIPKSLIEKAYSYGKFNDIEEITPTANNNGKTDTTDNFLPMWGTMWMFKEYVDVCWLNEEGGLQHMADCGFRVYEIEEGYIFGIDGAGYDFYESHWIPLYKARGLAKHLNHVPDLLG